MAEASNGDILHADTSIGAVTLRVGDLEGMSDYYSRAFAMELTTARGTIQLS